jgi:hypothetical protein
LRQAFADTIEDYRDWCKERGVEPEKPYSGTLSLRIAPELHRRVAEQAAKVGESINQFIAKRLERSEQAPLDISQPLRDAEKGQRLIPPTKLRSLIRQGRRSASRSKRRVNALSC